MKVFRIACIQAEPLAVIADTAEEAHLILIDRLMEAFGHVPCASYAVTEWEPELEMKDEPLWMHTEAGHRGIAFYKGHGWFVKRTPV